MALSVKASALFKKRNGALYLSGGSAGGGGGGGGGGTKKNNAVLSWSPAAPPGAAPEVTVPVPNITNLQQNKPKALLRIFAQTAGSVEPITYTFQLSSPDNAQAEADMLRDALSTAIQAAKNNGGTTASSSSATIEGQASSSAASPSVAKAFSASAGTAGAGGGRGKGTAAAGGSSTGAEFWFDDEKLKSNTGLQQSLLKASPALSKTLMESLKTKPDSISISQFTQQFWASRLNLLRAHAIEQSQTKGAYNVLSTIKSRTEDSVQKLNITREQINLIFGQHPLVKRVYDENVPRLSEEEFWSRFFQSRLLKRLKGERVTEDDARDAVLDRYLSLEEYDDSGRLQQRLEEASVPHIIDLAGNEENHSQRKGNRPDVSMRPTPLDRVPIIRTLNSLSEKIVAHVTPSDADPSAPIGMDEETFNSLALRDLQGDEAENRILLNIKDQGRFFASGKDASDETDGGGTSSFAFAHIKPKRALEIVRADVSALANIDLNSAVGLDKESDSDSDDDNAAGEEEGEEIDKGDAMDDGDGGIGSSSNSNSKKKRKTNPPSFRSASAHVFSAVAAQRAQDDDSDDESTTSSSSSTSSSNLPPAILERLRLTHATTTEFLSHFWAAFLSGDASPSAVEELRKLVDTLDRAMDRIRAVADDAEAERQVRIRARKRQLQELYERTRRRVEFDESRDMRGAAGAGAGGRVAVERLVRPTIAAIARATERYKEALREQEQRRQKY